MSSPIDDLRTALKVMANDTENAQLEVVEATSEPISKNKRYRKPKPWDTDDIDHVHPCFTEQLLILQIVEDRTIYKRRQSEPFLRRILLCDTLS